MPAKSASKSEWEAYAQSLGIEVGGKTKADLQQAVSELQSADEQVIAGDTDESQEGSESDADDESDASNDPDETSA
ncbi:hypothetical protein [Demequina flava]|uniref:hypothetical protein n=1 Tax=Demequina flava TaxID=1095025 RepID=UPI00128AEE7C|nr:hypothetical protein [Demequina flava]